MADHHRHHQRPNRISVPSRSSYTTLQHYPQTPTPTPSKHRLSTLSVPFKPSSSSKSSSISSLLLLLFSLRSLYSLFPALRSSSPSFSLFPFSFLFSLLSFILSLLFSLKVSPLSSIFSVSTERHKLFVFKGLVLGLVIVLRFQALKFCGTAAMILAELCGNVVARFVSNHEKGRLRNRFCGFLLLGVGLLFFSFSWDRIECFPLSTSFIGKYGFLVVPRRECVRFWPMLLPFLCGFLGCYEKVNMNFGLLRQLGKRQVRLVSLFYATIVLFFPAVVSFLIDGGGNGGGSIGNLSWPLANIVVFGVLLSENYGDDKLVSSKEFRREFLVTFICTIVLELFYFPELSLWGLLLCGLLVYFAVRELDPVNFNYVELGLESSESFSASVMKPIRHILSERKSRKIALFLLINACYMVVEFVVGFMSNSLGLVSDACHMLFDCAALAIGLYASYISRLPANHQFNYGRGRFEVLSGYVNAVFLVLVGALIVLESIERILDPQEISTNSLLVVSIGGLVVNVVGLVFFHEEHHHAHGGSCSHSQSHSHSPSHSHTHSHSHSHPQSQSHSHHHHHGHECDHDHKGHEAYHESISVLNNHHESSLAGHKDHHEHHHCNDHVNNNACENRSACCHMEHNHANNYNCQTHGHHHDHHHGHHHEHHHGHHHEHQHEHHYDHHHESHGIHHHHHNHIAHTGSHIDQIDLHHSGTSRGSSTGMTHEKEQKNSHHHHIDHNMEGIFLHVLADTMGSVGVVISTLLIKYKGWLVADPASSIFISVLIISSVIPLLRNSAEILLQRVPRAHEHDIKEAVSDVIKMKGIQGIQSLHVWSFTTTDIVGTLNLHTSAETDKAALRTQVSEIFQSAGVKDLTIQVECVK